MKKKTNIYKYMSNGNLQKKNEKSVTGVDVAGLGQGNFSV